MMKDRVYKTPRTRSLDDSVLENVMMVIIISSHYDNYDNQEQGARRTILWQQYQLSQ